MGTYCYECGQKIVSYNTSASCDCYVEFCDKCSEECERTIDICLEIRIKNELKKNNKLSEKTKEKILEEIVMVCPSCKKEILKWKFV